jgi:type II secretory pathway component PulM
MGLMATRPPATTGDRLAHWWQIRSRGERRTLGALAVLVSIAIVWLAVWQPMMRDIERLEQRAAADRALLAEARRSGDEIATLARAPSAPPGADPRAALDAALTSRNLRAAVTQIERVDNDRFRVTFDSIGFDALAGLLDALQRDARVRATDLVATARVETGLVRADVTLTR